MQGHWILSLFVSCLVVKNSGAFGVLNPHRDAVRPAFSLFSSTATAASETPSSTPNKLQRQYETFLWEYYGKNDPYSINYRSMGPEDGPPVLMIHGFGANVNHFRYNMPLLAGEGYRVYAIDLIGFGASSKPPSLDYSIEIFAQLCQDFIQHVNEMTAATGSKKKHQSWIVAGNSIGGLVSLLVTQNLLRLKPEEADASPVKGIVLFNCAGGMSGFRYEDVPWFLQPVLYFVQNVVLAPGGLGSRFFANFRTRENVESILKESGVYRNTTNVNEELMELLLAPADDAGAEAVFLKVFGGQPGPTPESILPTLKDIPILALWGTEDPWTPVDQGMHPGINFNQYVPDNDLFRLELLPGAGHCPHDEFPDLCHERMIPWLRELEPKVMETVVEEEKPEERVVVEEEQVVEAAKSAPAEVVDVVETVLDEATPGLSEDISSKKESVEVEPPKKMPWWRGLRSRISERRRRRRERKAAEKKISA